MIWSRRGLVCPSTHNEKEAMATGSVLGRRRLPSDRRAEGSPHFDSKEGVERTLDTEGPRVHDVRINHRRPNVVVSEELLNRSQVGTRLEEVGGEGVPERMTADRFLDLSDEARAADSALQSSLMEVMTPALTAHFVRIDASRWKHPLPTELQRRARILSRERERNLHGGETARHVSLMFEATTFEVMLEFGFERSGQ